MSFNIERIRKSTRRMTKFIKRNPNRPSSEAVHKLRTSARHLESALITWKLGSKRGVDTLLRELKKARRLAGKVRDMDVLTANALTVDWRGEQDCLVRLLEYLGAERTKRARKLRTALAKKRPRALRSLERGLKHLERAAAETGTNKGSGAVPAATARAIRLSAKLSRPGRLSRSNLHAYRLTVKDVRDVLRLSDRSADSALVHKLDQVKDAIGDWHDWGELTEIAIDVLDHGRSCGLTKRLADTRDTKYRHALSLTEALVSRLRPRPRKAGKRARQAAPFAEPVLEAVAAIAQEDGPELAH